MQNTLPREYSHQNNLTIEKLANSLGIPIAISNDSNGCSTEQFKPLPCFKIVYLAEGAYGAFELELIAKAKKWQIPFNQADPDFHELENDVQEYEELMNEATLLSINWDFNVYDLMGLKQAIEEREAEEYTRGRELRNDYYSSRGV